MKYVLITMCPPNLSVYEISVSIFPINCVTHLFTVFFFPYMSIFCYLWDGDWIKNENKGIILPHLWIFSFFTYNLYIICDLFESVIYNLCDYDISIMFWSTYVSPIIPDVQKKRFINSNSVLFIYKSAISAHKDCYTPQCLWNRRKPFPVAKKHVSFYP